MEKADVLRAWGRIVSGYYPSLSVEITRECPLRCPGCYAYEPEHLGAVGPLRSLTDRKGTDLVEGVVALVRRYRALHVSIVGGEPLVKFRELDILLPRLSEMGVRVQVVTSAVRTIPIAWSRIKGLTLTVSIDGLQPEHDARRKPATYKRILKNISGHRINVHCTITRQMLNRDRYFHDFISFWSDRPEVRSVWFSFFTPQRGVAAEENLSATERIQVVTELLKLREKFPKAYLPDNVLDGYRKPPRSPAECTFARTTINFTADLKNRISPCQFGGEPECSQCGCLASAGLNAIAEHRLLKIIPVRSLYEVSDAIGKRTAKIMGRA